MGLRRQPVLADAAYYNSKFRAGLASWGLQYMVGVEATTTVWEPPIQPVPPRRRSARGRPLALRELALALPPQAWRSITWRQGMQGPQRGRFSACRVQPVHGQAHHQPELESVWLLMEWPPDLEAPINNCSPTCPKMFRCAAWCAWPSCAGGWNRITISSRKNWGWTTTTDAAGKAGITMSPWCAWPVPSCCWSAGALKKTPLPTLPQTRRCLQMVLLRLFGRCPACRQRFIDT